MSDTKVIIHEQITEPFLPPCRVCGDKAAGFHYGVNTCEACKGFFHRSLSRYKEYKCRADRTSGYCEYKPGKRKSCQFCRFQKCLHAGMSRDAIKTGRYTYLKKTQDTREIKILLGLERPFISDPLNVDSSSAESTLTSLTPIESGLAELPVNGYLKHIFAEFDSDTKDRLYISENMHDDSCVYLSDSSLGWSANSSSCKKRHKQANPNTKNKSRCGNQTELSHTETCPSYTSVKSLIHGHVILDKQSSVSSKLNLNLDSQTDQHKNLDLLYTSEIVSPLIYESSKWTYRKLYVPYHQKHFRKSAVHRLPRIEDKYDHFLARNGCKVSNNNEYSNIIQESHETLSDTANPLCFSSEDSCSTSFNDSFEEPAINLAMVHESYSHTLAEPVFDLFPDISFCLGAQSESNQSSIGSGDNESPSTMETSSSCSSLSPNGHGDASDGSTLSPWETMDKAMGNMKWIQVDMCNNIEGCSSNIDKFISTNEEQNLTQNIQDDISSQITENNKPDSDLQVESPYTEKVSTPTQNLSIRPSHTDTCSSDSILCQVTDKEYLVDMSSASRNLYEVKNLQTVNVSDLYRDKDTVIAVLMASHKENIDDYRCLSKIEMLAQQRAHYEACLLKKQTFGDLGFLEEQEYDDIYSITGMDVDNRRLTIHKYLSRIEKQVRGLVQFAMSIPGFSYLDIDIQRELIKLARPEFAIFTTYPTVNLELGITIGLTGEHWACNYELGTLDVQLTIAEYMTFCDKLQKMAPTQEEDVLLKAILIVSTDRDSSVISPLAEVIKWQLLMCLLHIIENNREKPSICLARYILALTQSRTVAESVKDFLRQMKLRKYSSIEQNPLLWEMYSWILLEKTYTSE